MERDEEKGMAPEQAAKKICRVAFKRNPKPAYAIGLPYSLVLLLTRILPGRLLSWIIWLNYGK